MHARQSIFPTLFPHLPSPSPIGFTEFDAMLAGRLTSLANNDKGVATFWLGNYPCLYITNNQARAAIVRESHIGHIDDESVEHTRRWKRNNRVMIAFPVFQNINSKTYQQQRSFLLKQYAAKAENYLPRIKIAAETFFESYRHTTVPLNTKEFLLSLVLRTSSELLELHETPLDLIFNHPGKLKLIRRVAHYLVTETGDFKLEQDLNDCFREILARNFLVISQSTAETNLIKNIFQSYEVVFPETIYSFDQMPSALKHTIAMNFMATAMGGMVHSTHNSLDWAISRLLANQPSLKKLTQLVRKVDDRHLIDYKSYDKHEALGEVCTWVLENVFLYPTFSHEFYYNRLPCSVVLVDGSEFVIPENSVVIANYKACNQAECGFSENFVDQLAPQGTTNRFIHDSRNASFGGSTLNKSSSKTRICPGAKVSLLEQMILTSLLLKRFDLGSETPMSVEANTAAFPLLERVDVGDFRLSFAPPPTESRKAATRIKEPEDVSQPHSKCFVLN